MTTRSADGRADAYLPIHSTLPCQSIRLFAQAAQREMIDGADLLIYGDPRPSRVTFAMMYLDAPPRIIETKVFSAMPEAFRRSGRAHRLGRRQRRGRPIVSSRARP
jgi:hypothetical protein